MLSGSMHQGANKIFNALRQKKSREHILVPDRNFLSAETWRQNETMIATQQAFVYCRLVTCHIMLQHFKKITVIIN